MSLYAIVYIIRFTDINNFFQCHSINNFVIYTSIYDIDSTVLRGSIFVFLPPIPFKIQINCFHLMFV